MTDPRDFDPLMELPPDPRPQSRIRRDPRRALAYLVLATIFAAIVILALLVAPPGAGGRSQLPAVSFRPVEAQRAPDATVEPVPAADGEQQSDGGAVSSDDTVSGVASYVAPSYGRLYLALPEGPGHRVTICAKRCVTRWSTDAGPDRAMQRAGRVADLSFADFQFVCRCWPPSLGLVRVTVQRGGGRPTVTLPPTDLAP